MVEQINYEVIKKTGKIEFRRYPKIIIAKVDSYGDGGFNILFQYISGKNNASSEIAMTAPVISQEIAMTAPVISQEIAMTAPVISEGGSIAFVMPAEYSMSTIPKPIDDRISILEIPERKIAALRFSGRWTNSLFENKSIELVTQIVKQGIKTKGNVFSMRYSSPFTPWFLRRNEVAIEVEI